MISQSLFLLKNYILLSGSQPGGSHYYSLVLSLIAMENGFQLNLYPPNIPGGQLKWWTIGYYIWAEATWQLPPATECSFTMKKLDGIFLIWKFRFLGPGMSLLWSVPLTSVKIIQVLNCFSMHCIWHHIWMDHTLE